jgi:hypothetical protein
MMSGPRDIQKCQFLFTQWGPNRSGARAAGVSWDSHAKRWKGVIKAEAGDGESKQRHLGCFVNEGDAALAYDQAAREHHGDKAKLNFPDLPPRPQAASSKVPRKATSQYRGKGGALEPCLVCLPGDAWLAMSIRAWMPLDVCGPATMKLR